ncbi:MAG: thioesterase family protein [Vampirovibrionales bacterium]|nr:thioesterase family protein [Vampirovibrionales bacterium]
MQPFITQVAIPDTDCYGVAWHGSYTRWLEAGRVDWFAQQGYTLPGPPHTLAEGEEPLVFPVIEQHLRFKAPARLWDELTIVTQVQVEGRRLIFPQKVLKGGTPLMEATTTCVVIHGTTWKPYRSLPDTIAHLLPQPLHS